MKYSISDLIPILQARVLALPNPDFPFSHLCTDSRRISFPKESLFFCLQGQRYDGHDFLPMAYEAGIRNFILSREVDPNVYPEANLLLVPDVLLGLQKVALFHRKRFEFPVIGITGSNGKTIVKEWLFQLLQPDRVIVRSPRSYNSQLGVPLSIWGIQPEHELAIFEAGVSRFGEMKRIAPLIHCDIGLFTNIGEAHSEGFSSIEEKVREKLQLFQFAKVIIYCRDYGVIDREVQKLSIPVFSWSRRKKADLRIFSQEPVANRHMLVRANYQERELSIQIPFTDQASVENAIHCWATLLYLGYDHHLIAERLLQLEPVAMRMELKAGINHCVVINDSYNSDINALNIALQFLSQQTAFVHRTLILSDILQSGIPPEKLYQKVAGMVLANEVNRLIGIGQEVPVIASFLPSSVATYFFRDTDDFLTSFDHLTFEKEAILLKGARDFTFERIAQLLAQKAHRTVLEVDMNAIQHNLAFFHRQLKAETRLMVMVKAAAYGSGSLEVAKLLAYQSIHYLAVAYADEGVELRRGGIQLPIMVLNPEPKAFELMLRYRLEPEIYSIRMLKEWIDFVEGNENLPGIHLKIDSGMHRLGFELAELSAALRMLKKQDQIRVLSVFSHLAASEAAQHDDFTHQQFGLFMKAYEVIVQELGYPPLRHILNSSGILRFPQYQFEMVRLGIGLYGIDASNKMQKQLRCALFLKAGISQIKQLKAGDTVGYGRVGKIERPSRLATVSIGYADGLPRSAGNGRYALIIHGKKAPIIGSVCMDMCMADISDIPEAAEGDEVLVFGAEPTVEDLARCDQTIPYEILTRISARVKRVYIRE